MISTDNEIFMFKTLQSYIDVEARELRDRIDKNEHDLSEMRCEMDSNKEERDNRNDKEKRDSRNDKEGTDNRNDNTYHIDIDISSADADEVGTDSDTSSADADEADTHSVSDSDTDPDCICECICEKGCKCKCGCVCKCDCVCPCGCRCECVCRCGCDCKKHIIPLIESEPKPTSVKNLKEIAKRRGIKYFSTMSGDTLSKLLNLRVSKPDKYIFRNKSTGEEHRFHSIYAASKCMDINPGLVSYYIGRETTINNTIYEVTKV